MMQQASYLRISLLAAHENYLSEEIAQGTGYILPPNRIEIPRPPFWGDQLTLNNINVSQSTIGAINTGTVQQLDSAITLFAGQGQGEIATAVKDLTQAIIDNVELEASVKDDLAQQLAFLVTQLAAKPEQRSRGIIRSVLSGISGLITNSASLMTLWDKLRPLVERTVLGD